MKNLAEKITTEVKEIIGFTGSDHGWGNGYVTLPKGHPWYEVEYDNIDVNIHGGLTFGEMKEDGWVIGFVCLHYGDTMKTCPKKYVEEQVENLKKQAIAAIK